MIIILDLGANDGCSKQFIKIILFMRIIKIIIRIRKEVKNRQNVENLKFIKIKNRHLKYAPL
jgi:hypothetical protein